MNLAQLNLLIDICLNEVNEESCKIYRYNVESVNDLSKVLLLLREEALIRSTSINIRVFRAMHDIGMSAYKDFENSPLEKAINDLTEFLYNEVPNYKSLKPLKEDFGKHEPI